jgi:hypothetical protein
MFRADSDGELLKGAAFDARLDRSAAAPIAPPDSSCAARTARCEIAMRSDTDIVNAAVFHIYREHQIVKSAQQIFGCELGQSSGMRASDTTV